MGTFKKKPHKTRVFSTPLISILLLAFIMINQAFHTIYGNEASLISKYVAEEPTLDGIIDPNEWQHSQVYSNVGGSGVFNIHLMHGEDHFFIGIRIDDPTEDSTDRLFLYFDEGDDGLHGSGSRDKILTDQHEDYKSIGGDNVLRNGWWDTIEGSSYFYYSLNQPQDSIDFESSGLESDATETILTIDGVEYSYTQLPESFLWVVGSSHIARAMKIKIVTVHAFAFCHIK